MIKMTEANCDLIANRLCKVKDVVRDCLTDEAVSCYMRNRLLSGLYILDEYINMMELGAVEARIEQEKIDKERKLGEMYGCSS